MKPNIAGVIRLNGLLVAELHLEVGAHCKLRLAGLTICHFTPTEPDALAFPTHNKALI